MIKIYDKAYSRVLWIILYQSTPKELHEGNATCIAQIIGGYIKVIKPSRFHQDSSLHMSFRKVVKSIFNK